jgi:hypothetical protein
VWYGNSNMDFAARGWMPRFLAISGIAGLVAIFCGIPSATAQETYQQPSQEIVVNLAAGRVVIAVVKDAILIGTVENPIEAGTRVPAPVQMSTERVGIFLGADEWVAPATQQQLARLDRELPRLRRTAAYPASMSPHLQQAEGGGEATDIIAIGQGVLERLNSLASGFHNKISLAADEPLAEVIIADYLAGYGPEVWQISYLMEQDVTEQLGYWNTRVQRPRFLQFWPPGKKEPKTLIEFAYPSENAPPTLLDLLRQKDPRLQAVITSDPQTAEVAGRFLEGESTKVPAEEALQFLRAALDAVSPPKSKETIAVLRPEASFQWVLQPPVEPPSTLKPASPREPGAPSLASPPHPQP